MFDEEAFAQYVKAIEERASELGVNMRELGTEEEWANLCSLWFLGDFEVEWCAQWIVSGATLKALHQ